MNSCLKAGTGKTDFLIFPDWGVASLHDVCLIHELYLISKTYGSRFLFIDAHNNTLFSRYLIACGCVGACVWVRFCVGGCMHRWVGGFGVCIGVGGWECTCV